MSEDDLRPVNDAQDHIYNKSSSKSSSPSDKKLDEHEIISKNAYATVLLNYMRFCAARSVAVTDIEEQCNWFLTRIKWIKDCLKKLKKIALGLLIAIVVVYIPFFVLQWNEITANPVTVIIAAASFIIPLAVLAAVFVAVWRRLRRRLREAWDEYVKKSKRAIKSNAKAAREYDDLLSIYIPSLRYIYEYRNDVEFYADCCRTAKAKVAHHAEKLKDRIDVVGNIIDDLEVNVAESVVGAGEQDPAIDYNLSFCSGVKNEKFYTIIGAGFFSDTGKGKNA